jgi:carbamoyl-phosphate synthase large subunit
MQGLGNDYIYVDCLTMPAPAEPEELAVRLSDRNFGIGSDGLVLILPPGSGVADAQMRMFNADGTEGRMCGNAIRCVAKYLYERAGMGKQTMHIETLSGVKALELAVEGGRVASVTVNMGLAGITAMPQEFTGVDMGNPHAVIFVPCVEAAEVRGVGMEYQDNPLFTEGVNVEFVQVVDRLHLKMRVWERGSGETLACGTGACAAVVAAILNGFCDANSDIEVALRGGRLVIKYTEHGIYMTGGAEFVFEGVVEV